MKIHERVRSRPVRRGIGFVVDALAILVGVVVGTVALAVVVLAVAAGTGVFLASSDTVLSARGGRRRGGGDLQVTPAPP